MLQIMSCDACHRVKEEQLEGGFGQGMRRGKRHLPHRSMDLEMNIVELKNRGLTSIEPGFEEILPETVSIRPILPCHTTLV